MNPRANDFKSKHSQDNLTEGKRQNRTPLWQRQTLNQEYTWSWHRTPYRATSRFLYRTKDNLMMTRRMVRIKCRRKVSIARYVAFSSARRQRSEEFGYGHFSWECKRCSWTVLRSNNAILRLLLRSVISTDVGAYLGKNFLLVMLEMVHVHFSTFMMIGLLDTRASQLFIRRAMSRFIFTMDELNSANPLAWLSCIFYSAKLRVAYRRRGWRHDIQRKIIARTWKYGSMFFVTRQFH